MDLRLKRNSDGYRADGIFSRLTQETDGNPLVASTLEHAYPLSESQGWTPKIYPGTFVCVRGKHRLNGMTEDFETFEITGVNGHKNLLFHWGNYNENSEGCILTGEQFVEAPLTAKHEDMVTNSRATFEKFMELQAGLDQFNLTVEA